MRTWVGCAVLLACCAGCVGEGTSRSDALARQGFREIVTDAKDKVFPAVVFIRCLRESHESGRKKTQEISGSGVLVSSDGEVVTNWHVVDKAVEVRCLLYDGQNYDAEVVGSDKDTDLALLKLKLPEGAAPLPFAVLGDSTILQEGDFVMAMGAPWGLSRSVSIGIVSCTKRYLPGASEYSQWLQTDAAISPGNSGGPLVNTVGEIVGINARGIMSGGDTGFTIPSETVSFVAGQLREHGKVDWSWTGLRLQALRNFNKNIYFDADEGVIVASTDPDSPSRDAGLETNDRIVKINGQAVTAANEEDLPRLRKLIGLLPRNQEASIEIVRDGAPEVIALTPRAKGEVEGDELDCPRWDLTVKDINQFENPELFLHRKEGVFVFGVKSPGNASNAEFHTEDIILKVGGTVVKTLDEVKAVHAETLAGVDKKHRIVFTILRNGLMRQIVLDFMRDYEKE
jgi:serine protease Do